MRRPRSRPRSRSPTAAATWRSSPRVPWTPRPSRAWSTSGSPPGRAGPLHGRSLAVGKDTAEEHGWHVGDRVRIWLGDGTPARLRVAGVYERPLGFGDVVLPAPVLRGHVTDMLADAVLVSREPGVDERELETALGTLTGTARCRNGHALAVPRRPQSRRTRGRRDLPALRDHRPVLRGGRRQRPHDGDRRAWTRARPPAARGRDQAPADADDPGRDADRRRVRDDTRHAHRRARARRLQLRPDPQRGAGGVALAVRRHPRRAAPCSPSPRAWCRRGSRSA